MIYVRDDIFSKMLTKYYLHEDTEIVFIELKSWKYKWLLWATYLNQPPNVIIYFFMILIKVSMKLGNLELKNSVHRDSDSKA